MTQPPGQQPPQGSFGAPYDPPQGAPRPSPGYGYPPAPGPYGQQPGPYSPQPGPYGQAPGPYAQQPGYGMPPQQPTATAPGGPTGPGGGRFRGRTGIVIGAALAVLLLAGGGIWLATGDDDGGRKKPVAGPTGTAKPGPTKGGKDEGDVAGPTAAELNAGRKPGEAKVAWIKENGVDLPQYGEATHGPWFAGDIVAKGMYRKVTGYDAADGTERWSLDLPTDLCASPTAPTADGKVVVGIEDNVSEEQATCSVLQMIDLRTGKAGWKKTVDRSDIRDGLSHVAMAVSGDTVTFGRDSATDAFRVGDGKELFGRREGVCQPYAFTGGARMLAAVNCQKDAVAPVREQLQEVDPVTGAPKWTYDVEPGWKVTHVYSASPPVLSIGKDADWAVVFLNENGTFRSQLVPGNEDYGVRCGEETVQAGGNLDGCAGVAADDTRFYFSTQPKVDESADGDSAETNKVVAFDLATGKAVWKTPAPGGRLILPLRTEGGKVVVHVQASYSSGGEIGALAPSTGAYTPLLKHPASAAKTEGILFQPRAAWHGGRSYLLPYRISEDEDEAEMAATAVLVFGP
ncbi:PQQ-binding-like beta-propeller repeat protein [Streptomyces sp. NPDC047973]|uniref:outer membrane protein assembly factor BamB family protein n=1 Tax=Streptomyces sp. NPDC047973 TaxID=3155383 RepID=UPI0034425826